MVQIGPVTPEIANATTAAFLAEMAKSAYSTKYLDNDRTDLHHVYSISSHMYDDYKAEIGFAVAQGTMVNN